MNALRLGILSVLLGLVFGCTSGTVAPPPEPDAEPAFADEYKIGIGDNIAVDVYQHDDISAAVLVRPDGKITVPVAGDIMVGGKTPEEVASVIATELSEYVRDPIVTVTVVGMGSAEYLTRVRVTGAVEAPQTLPYRAGMTVMDVVLEAGGPNEFANSSKTVLYRNGERIRVRLDRILNRGDMSTNYSLRPGDIITIPERIF
ncbi:MAG: polysaccharide biosynthesis/export family protein [Pseudomonadales bacterium]